MAVLLVVAAFLRVVWLGTPNRPAIFDESYYVNAARVLIGHSASGHYRGLAIGLDPNREHPPLGKALIALSMTLFGDGPLGWRLPSVLAGTGAVALVYALVRAAGSSAWLAVGAAGLCAFDCLALVSARSGRSTCPWLRSSFWAHCYILRGKPVLAAVACALAAVIKIAALLVLLAWSSREVAQARTRAPLGSARVDTRDTSQRPDDLHLRRCRPGVLWTLDLRFTTFQTPWEHLAWIWHAGFSLQTSTVPPGPESLPWQWIVNQGQMTYYREAGVFFHGALNPIIIGAAPLAAIYSAWLAWRYRDLLSIWVVAWIVTNYLVPAPRRPQPSDHVHPLRATCRPGDRGRCRPAPGGTRHCPGRTGRITLRVGIAFIVLFPFGPWVP